ncbi:hypothetical protein [Bifidobacterium saguini]|nr:hypothetical protein [Bifidobacterium saguini]
MPAATPVAPHSGSAPVSPTPMMPATDTGMPAPSIPQPAFQATTPTPIQPSQPAMPQIPLPQNTAPATDQSQQTAPAAPLAADAEFDKTNTTWTLVQVMKERTLVPFLVAVLALFMLFEYVSNIVIFIVVLVLGYLCGAVLMLLYLQRNKTPHVEATLVRYCRAKGIDPKSEMKFTWYSYYSVIVGFVLWAIFGTLISMLLQQIAGNDIYTNTTLAMLTAFVPMIVSYFIARYAIKFIDKAIYARAHTNDLRIAAIAEGYYDSEFKDAEQLQKTVFLLKKNRVQSVAGAKRYVSLSNGLKKAGIIGGIITAILGILTFGMISKIGKGVLDTSTGGLDLVAHEFGKKAGNGVAQQAAQNAVQNIAQQYQNNIIAQNITSQINNAGNGNPIPNLQNLNIPDVGGLVDGAKEQLKHFGFKS